MNFCQTGQKCLWVLALIWIGLHEMNKAVRIMRDARRTNSFFALFCSCFFLSLSLFFCYELHKSNFYGEHFFCIIFFCLNSSAAVVFYHLQIANLILRYENIIWCSYLNVALCCYWFQSFWKKSKKCLFFLFLQFKSMKNIRI